MRAGFPWQSLEEKRAYQRTWKARKLVRRRIMEEKSIVEDFEWSEPKVHSVIYSPVNPAKSALGRIYLRKESGLTTAKRIRITIEVVE